MNDIQAYVLHHLDLYSACNFKKVHTKYNLLNITIYYTTFVLELQITTHTYNKKIYKQTPSTNNKPLNRRGS